MGLFGGDDYYSSTEKRTTNIDEDISKAYADYSTIDGLKSENIIDIREGQNIRLNVTDTGAVKSAFDFSTDVVKDLFENASKLFGYAQEAQVEGYGMAQDVLKSVTETQRTEAENVMLNLVKWGAIAAVAIAAAYIIKGKI